MQACDADPSFVCRGVQAAGGPGAVKSVQVKGRDGDWRAMTNKCVEFTLPYPTLALGCHI